MRSEDKSKSNGKSKNGAQRRADQPILNRIRYPPNYAECLREWPSGRGKHAQVLGLPGSHSLLHPTSPRMRGLQAQFEDAENVRLAGRYGATHRGNAGKRRIGR